MEGEERRTERDIFANLPESVADATEDYRGSIYVTLEGVTEGYDKCCMRAQAGFTEVGQTWKTATYIKESVEPIFKEKIREVTALRRRLDWGQNQPSNNIESD